MAIKIEAVGIRLDARLKSQLQQEADSDHRTLSNLIAKILVDYCHSKHTSKPKHVNGHDHKVAKSAATA